MLKDLFIILFIAGSTVFAENSVNADPDLAFTGFEYAGATVMKIGDYLDLKYLQTGGFLEVRDEKCFNRKFLPNHNWRGYFFLYSNIFTKNNPEKKIYLILGYEHESAHPTMGIKNSSTNAFEKIYDDQYRNINLNSLLFRYNRMHLLGQNVISAKLDYQFYFKSNNTPELIGNTSAVSHGLSLGLEYTRNINELLAVYISVFDRYIFKGRKKTTGEIYFGNGEDFEQRVVSYPIINEVNTIAAKTGVLFDLKKIKRQAQIYCSVLYGNIFGFVDSRDKRLRIAGGICIRK